MDNVVNFRKFYNDYDISKCKILSLTIREIRENKTIYGKIPKLMVNENYISISEYDNYFLDSFIVACGFCRTATNYYHSMVNISIHVLTDRLKREIVRNSLNSKINTRILSTFAEFELITIYFLYFSPKHNAYILKVFKPQPNINIDKSNVDTRKTNRVIYMILTDENKIYVNLNKQLDSMISGIISVLR